MTEKKTVRLEHSGGGVVSVPEEKAKRLLETAGWSQASKAPAAKKTDDK